MKKLILKVIIFLSILSIFFIKLNSYILPLNINRTTIKMGLAYNANIYFIGNSHSYWAYNPLILENKTKNLVYNISTSGQSLESSYFLAKYLIGKKETKIIFFELFNAEISDKKIDINERVVFDYFPINFKYKTMKYFYKNKVDILRNIFNFNMHHNFWKNKNIFKKKLKFDDLDLYYSKNFTPFNGYVPHFNRDPSFIYKNRYKNIPSDYFKNNLKIKSQKELSKESLNLIIDLLEEAKKRNKIIIFLLSPFYFQTISSGEASEYVNFVKNIADFYHFETINFNEMYIQTDITREDFKDSGHLNYWGACKLSNYLSNYLLEKYHVLPSIQFVENKDKFEKNKKILIDLEKESLKRLN